MIFVTLGTQDKPFRRLLEAIQKEIDSGNIKDKVLVQGGCTKIDTKDMEIFDQVSQDDFEDMMNKCDYLITHAGVGSIITGLKSNKKVLAVARLATYGEAANDHQIQLIENFSELGYIVGVTDLNDFGNALTKIKKFKPSIYKSNTTKFIKQLENYIDSF